MAFTATAGEGPGETNGGDTARRIGAGETGFAPAGAETAGCTLPLPEGGRAATGSCQVLLFFGDGDVMPVDPAGASAVTLLDSEVPARPKAAGLSFGISSSGGGPIGVCAQGAKASYTSFGAW